MLFNKIFAAFAVDGSFVSSKTVPHLKDKTENPNSVIKRQDTFNCKDDLSSQCGHAIDLGTRCDEAKEALIDDYVYKASSYVQHNSLP